MPNAPTACMSLIQNFMPGYRLHQVDHVAVVTDPPRTFDVVRSVDLYRIGFARRLFALRLAPERALARLRGQPSPSLDATARIDQITAPGTGFHLLGENDHELVVGSVGCFWLPKIKFADVTAATFAGFHDPG